MDELLYIIYVVSCNYTYIIYVVPIPILYMLYLDGYIFYICCTWIYILKH